MVCSILFCYSGGQRNRQYGNAIKNPRTYTASSMDGINHCRPRRTAETQCTLTTSNEFRYCGRFDKDAIPNTVRPDLIKSNEPNCPNNYNEPVNRQHHYVLPSA